MTLQWCFNNCCVEEKPASALHNLPWGEEERVFSFIRVIHTNPWPRLWIHAWITCWLLWSNRIWPAFKQHCLGLSNAGVQIGYGESSSGSRAGSLVLELKARLKSRWADLLTWMRIAFMQGSLGRGDSSLHRAPGHREWLLSVVYSWWLAYVSIPAPKSLLKAVDPESGWGGKCSKPWTREKERVVQTYPKLVAL